MYILHFSGKAYDTRYTVIYMIQLIDLSYTFLLSMYQLICTRIICKLVFLINQWFLWWGTVERDSLWIAAFVHVLISLHWMSSRLNYSTLRRSTALKIRFTLGFWTESPRWISCLSWFETILGITRQSFPVTFSIPPYSCYKWYSHTCTLSDLFTCYYMSSLKLRCKGLF